MMSKPKIEPMIFISPQDDTPNEPNINKDQLENLQDILHQSYVNDQIKMYDVLNETQAILSDVWEFVLDDSVTSDKKSDIIYSVDGENGLIKFQDLLLDNNKNREHKISTSTYMKRRLKVIYREQSYSQNETQLSGTIEITYLYNKRPNNDYLIKVGDIIHDQTNPDTFWVVYKVEEQVKQQPLKINPKDFLQIYRIHVQRLNLSMLPKNIWKEYFTEPYPQDVKEEQKSEVEIIEGDITVEPQEEKPVKKEDERIFIDEEVEDQLEGQEESDLKNLIFNDD